MAPAQRRVKRHPQSPQGGGSHQDARRGSRPAQGRKTGRCCRREERTEESRQAAQGRGEAQERKIHRAQREKEKGRQERVLIRRRPCSTRAADRDSNVVDRPRPGEMTERPIVRHWKCRVLGNRYRGFESPSLRFSSFFSAFRTFLALPPDRD